MTSTPPPAAPGRQLGVTTEFDDPSFARERTALAWTRSALSIAVSGGLIARAFLSAHHNVLGTVAAISAAAVALVVWRYGQENYAKRGLLVAFRRRQRGVLAGLTTATLITALLAIIVTLAI